MPNQISISISLFHLISCDHAGHIISLFKHQQSMAARIKREDIRNLRPCDWLAVRLGILKNVAKCSFIYCIKYLCYVLDALELQNYMI